MKRNNQDARARLTAELILQVRSGMMTASEAATQLGVSRKTYYKWEKRGLAAMLDGLGARPPGRPASELDEEKESMKRRIQELERELRLKERTETLRELLRSGGKKKERDTRDGG